MFKKVPNPLLFFKPPPPVRSVVYTIELVIRMESYFHFLLPADCTPIPRYLMVLERRQPIPLSSLSKR